MTAPAQDHPPAPRLAIRVGVTGHRTRGLAEAGYDPDTLKESVHKVLSHIKQISPQLCQQDQCPGVAPLLRVVSPLAEGADRIVAQEGLTLGYELESPLPFPRAEYEKDFQTEESRHAFRTLLEQATLVIELEGTRSRDAQAYEAVGRWVLLNSDVLIAIWNGKPAAGIGGTGQMVQESLLKKTPTVWVQPSGQTCLLTGAKPISFEDINHIKFRLQQSMDIP